MHAKPFRALAVYAAALAMECGPEPGPRAWEPTHTRAALCVGSMVLAPALARVLHAPELTPPQRLGLRVAQALLVELQVHACAAAGPRQPAGASRDA